MNSLFLLADISQTTLVIGGVAAFLFVFFMFIAIWASRYTKVGPNQVLVISGRKHRIADPDGTLRDVGFRIVKGGGVFVWPVYEKVDILSLELLTIDVQTPEVYTSKGVPVKVDGVAQIKVKGDDISIATASEQFLSKTTDEIKFVIGTREDYQWAKEKIFEHRLDSLHNPVEGCGHPPDNRVLNPVLHVLDRLAGVALEPVPVELLRHPAKLDDEVAGEIFRFDFSPLFLP